MIGLWKESNAPFPSWLDCGRSPMHPFLPSVWLNGPWNVRLQTGKRVFLFVFPSFWLGQVKHAFPRSSDCVWRRCSLPSFLRVYEGAKTTTSYHHTVSGAANFSIKSTMAQRLFICCCKGFLRDQKRWVPFLSSDICFRQKTPARASKVANPARGQQNRENECFSFPTRAWEFGLDIRVRQSRPASACSSPCSDWILYFLTSGERLIRGYRKFKIRLHGRRGKGTAESFSREKLSQAPQKEGGEILCDLPPVWPRLARPQVWPPK